MSDYEEEVETHQKYTAYHMKKVIDDTNYIYGKIEIYKFEDKISYRLEKLKSTDETFPIIKTTELLSLKDAPWFKERLSELRNNQKEKVGLNKIFLAEGSGIQ